MYQLIEEQNTTLCKLRELAHHNQLAQYKVRYSEDAVGRIQLHTWRFMLWIATTSDSDLWSFSPQPPEGVSESLALAQLQGELVGAQSSLFSLGLELEASQRSLRQSQRQGDDLMRFRDRLSADLQEVLQHREVTEKHNQVSQSNKV